MRWLTSKGGACALAAFAFACACAASCSSQTYVVVSVSSGQQLLVGDLHVEVVNAGQAASVVVGKGTPVAIPPARDFVLVLDDTRVGVAHVTVSALDAGSGVSFFASGDVVIKPGGGARVQLLLTHSTIDNDGEGPHDFSSPPSDSALFEDLSAVLVDTAVPADQAAAPDLTTSSPPDLYNPCLDNCRCADPRATCQGSPAECTLPMSQCILAADCPQNYVCLDGRCVCRDATCSRTCGMAGGACPGACGYRCDSANRCTPSFVCSLDAQCATGQRCLDGSCTAPGSGAVGSSCASLPQCASLSCPQSMCVQACTSNHMCAGGECAQMRVPSGEPPWPTCTSTVSCTGCTLAQYCLIDQGISRCVLSCALDGDCASAGAATTCVYFRPIYNSLLGICDTNPLPGTSTACRADEAVITDSAAASHGAPPLQCTQLAPCGSALDCPTQYPICASVGIASGLCGRAP